jgi:hypothetical protein
VRLELTAPLTNAGGTIPLIPGSDGSSGAGFTVGSGSAYWFVVQNGNGAFYPFTDGTVGAAPEPGFGSCSALFLLALTGIEGYKHWRRKLAVGGRPTTMPDADALGCKDRGILESTRRARLWQTRGA